MTCGLELVAVKLAVRGYRVVPTTRGDKLPPLESGRHRRATKDPVRVAELWRERPHAGRSGTSRLFRRRSRR